MSEWVTVIPDEFHFVTKRAHSLAHVDAFIRSAHEVGFKVNKHIPSPDELVVKCCFWSNGPYWTVKANVFGSDAQCVAFHTWWAWS